MSPATRRSSGAVTAALLGLALLSGCSGNDAEPASPTQTPSGAATTTPTTTSPAPSSSPTSSASSSTAVPRASARAGSAPDPVPARPAAALLLADPAIEVGSAEAMSRIRGASASFADYVLSYEKSVEDRVGGQCPVTIEVTSVDPRGFASGGTVECGGARTFWIERDGRWQVLAESQGVLPCEEFARHDWPAGSGVAECLDTRTGSTVRYAGP